MQSHSRAKLLRNLLLGLRGVRVAGLLVALLMSNSAFCADSQDPLLNLLLQKGILTEDEAKKVQAEAEASRTNRAEPEPSRGSYADRRSH